MSKRSGLALFLLFATLFFIVNRGAYKGYFRDDEMNNLSWTPYAPAVAYLEGVLTPRFQTNNFRPAGHFYFREAVRFFGLDFPKYVVVIHLLHLLNVWLVWLLVRRLGAPPLAAAGAVSSSPSTWRYSTTSGSPCMSSTSCAPHFACSASCSGRGGVGS